MRWLENLLLILGLTALGTVACSVGLTLFGLLTIFADRPGEQPSLNWGAYYGGIGTMICGGFLGAVIGFSVAISWINQRDHRPWALMTWLGIAIGVAAALALETAAYLAEWPNNSDVIRALLTFWPTAVVLLIAAGTIGGGLGRLMTRMQKRSRGHRI